MKLHTNDLTNIPSKDEVIKRWKKNLKDQLWYVKLREDIDKRLFIGENKHLLSEELKQEWGNVFKTIYDVVEGYYRRKEIPFGKNEINFDEDRKKIDTVVIHHSSGSDDVSWQRISVIDLLWVYCKEFLNPERNYYKKPIFSGHKFQGYESFIPYHYLVYKNGKVVQTLKDEHIGWHAGNWDVNTRSLAICLVGNYSKTSPNEKQISQVRKIISDYRIKSDSVYGHREVRSNRICPGNGFLGGWKKRII